MSVVDAGLQAWATALERASWQGGLAAAVVWLVCWLVPRLPARVQVVLWQLVLLKFLIAASGLLSLELPLASSREILPAALLPYGLARTNAPDTFAAASPAPLCTPVGALFLVWLALVGWQALRLCATLRAAERLRAACTAFADPEALSLTARMSRTLGLARAPALLCCPDAGSPFVLGLFRASVVLPTATWERLNDRERRLVLAHELAHLARHDLFWKLLATSVRAVFWFHPLAWLSERKLAVTQEHAADALAIHLDRDDPLRYAADLVSVLSKLGPAPAIPAWSVGAVGPLSSLQRRVTAMRYVRPASQASTWAWRAGLLLTAAVGLTSWKIVAAQTPEYGPVEKDVAVGRGKFLSFENGALKLQGNHQVYLWTKIPDHVKVFEYRPATKAYEPVPAAALAKIPPGKWTLVTDQGAAIRIGSRGGMTTGTFVSFKDQRLTMLGTNLGPSYAKKYGNVLKFNRFAPNVPVEESVDGGPYQRIGVAENVLGDVREGTILRVHGEGDDNITLIQLGVPREN